MRACRAARRPREGCVLKLLIALLALGGLLLLFTGSPWARALLFAAALLAALFVRPALPFVGAAVILLGALGLEARKTQGARPPYVLVLATAAGGLLGAVLGGGFGTIYGVLLGAASAGAVGAVGCRSPGERLVASLGTAASVGGGLWLLLHLL